MSSRGEACNLWKICHNQASIRGIRHTTRWHEAFHKEPVRLGLRPAVWTANKATRLTYLQPSCNEAPWLTFSKRRSRKPFQLVQKSERLSSRHAMSSCLSLSSVLEPCIILTHGGHREACELRLNGLAVRV